jgi:FkbM family methyltransferase
MSLSRILEHEGLKFEARAGTSDEKNFREVIEGGSYERKFFKIQAGERWVDMGGNVGAFALYAIQRGARVHIYEPDPTNCRQIERNLKLNGFDAQISQAAIVHDDTREVTLNLWPDGQSWRNSIVRNRRGTKPLKVPAVNYREALIPAECCKMDIEGAEIPILRSWDLPTPLSKLVFEWSFDAEPRVELLRMALGKLKKSFTNVRHTKQVETVEMWKFFPPCTTVHCFN